MSTRAQKANEPQSVDALTFEAALRELEDIVRQLESGEVELEKSLAIYERGAQLKAHCEAKLKSAQLRIDKIVLDGGEARAEPMDAG